MTTEKVVLMTTEKEVLQEARRLLSEIGWCQGHFVTDREFCIIGAICKALQETNASTFALLGNPPTGFTSWVDWNDAPGRTKEQVLEQFDRRIAAL